jgi:uncharacterized protein
VLLFEGPGPSGMPTLTEICAPDRGVHRYLPQRLFPAYRFVPGLQPHPVRDPAGHSQAETRRERLPSWDPSQWCELTAWLWGVDLFNAFFFWEAHEAWEGLWAAQMRTSQSARLLQGMIQIAAALLKVHLRSVDSAQRLARRGVDKVECVAVAVPSLLGLDLNATALEFRQYFRPLEERTLPPFDASVPVLELSGRAEP